jgi:DNA-binding CsgD family transcriptional regulator
VSSVSSPSAVLWDATAAILEVGPDPDRVLESALDSMRGLLGANRADGGFVRAPGDSYRPRRVVTDGSTPAVFFELSTDDELISRVLATDRAFAVGDVLADIGDCPTRSMLAETDTHAIVTRRLERHGDAFGLICLDWVGAARKATADELELVDLFVSAVLSPVLAMAGTVTPHEEPPSHSRLSAAELEVVRLAGEGLSYQHIAFVLDKSVNTVSHQLASARRKVGARNTAELCIVTAERPVSPRQWPDPAIASAALAPQT